MIDADLAVANASELLTVRGPAPRIRSALGDPGLVRGGWMAARGTSIVFVGDRQEFRKTVRLRPGAIELDATGRTVLPGFVDPHTHLPFAGWRDAEFVLRLEGATYESIAAAGGGIQATVLATRAAPLETLITRTCERLDRMLLHGTTTVEAKSGYGLSREQEIKQLEVLQRASREHPIGIVPTFLGAHIVPPERCSDRAAWVAELAEVMIPEVAGRDLARFCDVFVDQGAYTIDEGERILGAAQRAGLGVRVHADQRQSGGGAQLAARCHAASADHLDHVDDAGIAALAAAGTTAVLLPGASFFLRQAGDAPARRMIEAGVAVALATDFNPGTCPTPAMTAILPLACLRMGLLPAEAITAATLNAAHSLGLAARLGSLEVGKAADFQIVDVPGHVHLAYQFGVNHCLTVVKNGAIVVRDGRLTAPRAGA